MSDQKFRGGIDLDPFKKLKEILGIKSKKRGFKPLPSSVCYELLITNQNS